MKKYIRVTFRDKKIEPIHLSLEKWEAIVNDPKGLVAYKLDNETDWQGRVLNKAEIIFAEPDEDYTKKANAQLYDLYHHIPSNSVVKIAKGSLLPPEKAGDYRKI